MPFPLTAASLDGSVPVALVGVKVPVHGEVLPEHLPVLGEEHQVDEHLNHTTSNGNRVIEALCIETMVPVEDVEEPVAAHHGHVGQDVRLGPGPPGEVELGEDGQ